MPKELERKIRASVKKAHPEYSEARVNREVYATMNKRGLLRNSRAERESERNRRNIRKPRRPRDTRAEREQTRNRTGKARKR